MAATIRDNALRRGLDPSGTPLPRVDPDTMDRRKDREAQAARGGAADPRFRKHKKARANFRRRFLAPRVPGGPLHEPGRGVPRGLMGLESGLLFRSVAA